MKTFKKPHFKTGVSVLALVISLFMLTGDTVAWFTESKISKGNIIRFGELQAGLFYKNLGDEEYQDASEGAIFNYNHWEPGYTTAKIIKITNTGDFAFDYYLKLIPSAEIEAGKPNPADVIDVYVLEANQPVNRKTIAAETPVGTLSSLMADENGVVHDILQPPASGNVASYVEYCIALKARDTIGNEYQGLAVGGDSIDVQLLAIQHFEEDDDLDDDPVVAPTATDITYIGESRYNVAAAGAEPGLKLKVTYSDGTSKEVTITDDMYVVNDIYAKPNFQIAGKYDVMVVFEGLSVSFSVEIIERQNNVLITSEEFLYGSYFDHDKFEGNTGTRLTSGSYNAIRSADALLPAQDIFIKVTDTDLSNYKVTLGYFTKDGIYTGRTGILPMTNGEMTIKASEMSGSYFRVNVYIYTSNFPKVPESAQIVVYGKNPSQPEQPTQPDQPTPSRPWEGKKISVAGDSISTGGYPGILANMTGATIQNLSVSGTRLVGGLTSKIDDVAEDADLVIVFGGTNDYWHKNVNIGDQDSTDASTFVGALRYILKSLETNRPNAEYLFVFPPDQTFGGYPSSTDFGRGSLDDFRAAFLKFCEQYDLSYVDLSKTEFDSAKHSGDGVHPNAAGHQIIAEAICAAITADN